jgi:signal transduction histidine kinase
MGVVAFLLIQPFPVSIPLGVVILALVGVLLLAMILGGLLVLRLHTLARPSVRAAKPERADQRAEVTRPAQAMSSPRQNVILNALPFPAVLVSPDGRPLAVNAEATPWLEGTSPPRLASPLRTLVRRVADSREAEAVQITLSEGQPPLRMHASPLLGGGHRPGEPAAAPYPTGATLHGVLLLALSGVASASLDLTRLVAHELRTPLTAIVGHAEILESCDPTDEALWRRSRDFIAAETQRLARLMDDLFALSRLEASPPLLRTVNLRAVVESALSHLFDHAEAAELTLTLDAPSSLPRVRADPDQLEHALVNLLDNAIKYTPAGGTVTARLTSEGGYVRVEISDTGPGISPDDLPHLFEPLYRAESVRGLPGTGLGLTIVRAILDQHGAPISVRSTPGQGTTFTFRLPAAR